MEHKKKGLMIGISTNQNSTNLIPFLQSGCDTLILLETDLAIEKEWAKGFGYIAEERGKSFKTVAIGEGLDLEKIMNVIEEHIKDLEGDIYWNIGGGQKMQTFSMVMSFQKRIAAKYCDYIYYTEPQSRKTVQINYKEGQMQSRIDRTCVPDLKLEEINKIFGYKVSSPKKQILLWQRTGEKSGKLYKEKMLTDEQFDFFMNYDNRQKMFKYT
ncbi:MAG: DUF1887 family CARF protein, partial [bacterium]|nr:DUF1887 family CARF protein [bacterium]